MEESNKGNTFWDLLGQGINALGSIWGTSNKVKSDKLALQLIEKETEKETEATRQEQLLKALEIKKASLEAATIKDKANANIRALVYVLIAAVITLFAFKFWKPKGKNFSV